MSISVRLASPHDSQFIYNIQVKSWLETYPSLDFDITKDDIRALYRDDELWQRRNALYIKQLQELDKGEAWVALEGTHPCGWCSVEVERNHAEIKHLYVLPGSHGRGAGSALLNSAVEWLRTRNVNEFYVILAEYNLKGKQFYLGKGFKVLEGWSGSFNISPKKIPTIKMVCRLKPMPSPNKAKR